MVSKQVLFLIRVCPRYPRLYSRSKEAVACYTGPAHNRGAPTQILHVPRIKAMTKTNDSSKAPYDEEALLAAWHTSHRVTMYLIEKLPPELWSKKVPGVPRRTVRMIAAHLHNVRCMWIKMLAERHGIVVPRRVDGNSVRPAELLRALVRSSEGINALIRFGVARGGTLPPAAWQNFPTDVVHFLSYFVAHEAHHRGQLVMLARQLGCRLPVEVTAGLWQWKKRARE